MYNHLRQLSDDSPGASSAHSFLTSSRHAFAAATSFSQNEWISTCKCADADAESAHADLVTPRDKRELAFQCSLHVACSRHKAAQQSGNTTIMTTVMRTIRQEASRQQAA